MGTNLIVEVDSLLRTSAVATSSGCGCGCAGCCAGAGDVQLMARAQTISDKHDNIFFEHNKILPLCFKLFFFEQNLFELHNLLFGSCFYDKTNGSAFCFYYFFLLTSFEA